MNAKLLLLPIVAFALVTTTSARIGMSRSDLIEQVGEPDIILKWDNGGELLHYRAFPSVYTVRLVDDRVIYYEVDHSTLDKFTGLPSEFAGVGMRNFSRRFLKSRWAVDERTIIHKGINVHHRMSHAEMFRNIEGDLEDVDIFSTVVIADKTASNDTKPFEGKYSKTVTIKQPTHCNTGLLLDRTSSGGPMRVSYMRPGSVAYKKFSSPPVLWAYRTAPDTPWISLVDASSKTLETFGSIPKGTDVQLWLAPERGKGVVKIPFRILPEEFRPKHKKPEDDFRGMRVETIKASFDDPWTPTVEVPDFDPVVLVGLLTGWHYPNSFLWDTRMQPVGNMEARELRELATDLEVDEKSILVVAPSKGWVVTRTHLIAFVEARQPGDRPKVERYPFKSLMEPLRVGDKDVPIVKTLRNALRQTADANIVVSVTQPVLGDKVTATKPVAASNPIFKDILNVEFSKGGKAYKHTKFEVDGDTVTTTLVKTGIDPYSKTAVFKLSEVESVKIEKGATDIRIENRDKISLGDVDHVVVETKSPGEVQTTTFLWVTAEHAKPLKDAILALVPKP